MVAQTDSKSPLGAIDIEVHSLGGHSHRLVLNQFRIEAAESLILPSLPSPPRFEPPERRRERDARVPALARGQHLKTPAPAISVIGVLVAGQAAIAHLTKEIRKSKLAITFTCGDRRGVVRSRRSHRGVRPNQPLAAGARSLAQWTARKRPQVVFWSRLCPFERPPRKDRMGSGR